MERHYRRSRRLLTITAQTSLFLLSLLLSFLFRFDFDVPNEFRLSLMWAALAWIPVKIAALHLFRLDRESWRYFSARDSRTVAAASAAASLVTAILTVAFCPYTFPRSIYLLDFLLSLLFTVGARILFCTLHELINVRPRTHQRRTLIYGAGSAGVMLLQEVRNNSAFGNVICGFIDDDPATNNLVIHGTRVLGSGNDLGAIVRLHQIDEILIAIPSATSSDMSRIVGFCQASEVPFRTMPRMSEIISGRGLSNQMRDVNLDDVLGRSAVKLDRTDIDQKLNGRVILVTGAAGSIGSELCRQVAAASPAELVALDIAETPLFFLERELRQAYPQLILHTEIGSIQNVRRLEEIFQLYRPAVVYHAAAYKHVPLMEANVFEAVENNVIGTYNVATVAARFGTEDFVMISSDKAVRPTNIMGATKRAAELVIRSLTDSSTHFVSVRFGNVLGSNGSVVPLFRKQIAEGGPVVVTHPEMRRYFMTIPEAVQLVLQASTMGRGGEIFVLDMGKPVQIVDLARQLIRLSGLKPDEDIRIEFSGIRPGEKLYEELHTSDEAILPTSHSRIMVFAGHCPSGDRMMRHLTRLRAACDARDSKAVIFELLEIEPDYSPGTEVLTRAFEQDLSALARGVNVGSPLPQAAATA